MNVQADGTLLNVNVAVH